MNDGFGTLMFFVVVVVMVGGLFYFAHSKSSCDDAHGVLVKNAMGTYSCIEKGKH